MGFFLGIRSSSGSLDTELEKIFPIIQTARKLSKMVQEKEKLFRRFFKVAGRKSIGMLLLCAICVAIFFWVLNIGEAYPVCYLPVEEAIALMPKVPLASPVLQNLTFIYEENLSRDGEFGGSDFGGYPTLKQITFSPTIQPSMNIHCGFVRGIKLGCNTGYDMDEDDLLYME